MKVNSKKLILFCWKLLDSNHLNPIVYTYLAYVYLERQEYQKAYEYFLSSIHMGVIVKEGIADLARLLIESGQYDEAIKYLREGIEAFPEEEELNLLLGQAYSLSGESKKAIKILEGLIDTELPEVYKYLGLNYYILGENEQAVNFYKKYLTQLEIETSFTAIEELHQQIWGASINAG
jgi:tetratricopeptide (TPR) repeat protein